MICQKCSSECNALGRPLSRDVVPVSTLAAARAAARYCNKCNIVVCGACSGVPYSLAGNRPFAATCPRCNGYVDYATAYHVRETKTRIV